MLDDSSINEETIDLREVERILDYFKVQSDNFFVN